METFRGIVVGYDGSSDADVALEWAATAAALEHLPVRVVLVEDVDRSSWGTRHREADHDLVPGVDLVLEEAEVLGSTERRTGQVVPTLLEESRDARMLVVGSQGHGRAAEAVLGSVSQHLARHSPCPVVVVRTAAQPAATRIVVGIDGSGDSMAALEFACRRAELTGEDVVAVHAWKVGDLLVGRDGQLPPTVGADIESRELLLAESIAGVRTAHPDVALTQEAIPVAPGQALVDASSTASLVVTGSRGRGAFAGMLLGSISQEVLSGAHCPVAIVR